MLGHWSCQPEKNLIIIVILSFCNIVKGQANYTYESVFLDPDHLGFLKWRVNVINIIVHLLVRVPLSTLFVFKAIFISKVALLILCKMFSLSEKARI